jgi:hypothetical protein
LAYLCTPIVPETINNNKNGEIKMNKLNKLVTVMAVTTMALGVNAGDMKKIGLANPNTPTTPSLVCSFDYRAS